jgi:pimeloyl-ACP methyl ester carboxylesterase
MALLARYGSIYMALLVCITVPAHAAPVAWKEDMVCGKDPQRPDHQPGLAQRYVVTPNGAIAYYSFGQGNPIVLVTGYRATIANWNAYFLGELAKHHRVIVLDNRGIGGSVSQATRYGMADLARDTLTLIQTLKLRDVTLVGWSMGGMVAQTLLMQHPDRIRDAVLMNTAPPGHGGDAVPADVMRILSGAPGTTFGQVMSVLFPANVEEQAEQCFARDMFKPADYGPVRVPAQVAQSQDALLGEWSADKQAFRRLRGIKVPVLVLSSQNDAVLAPANAAALNKAIPRSSLVEASDAGHAMMYQYPRALAQRIIKFIDTSL